MDYSQCKSWYTHHHRYWISNLPSLSCHPRFSEPSNISQAEPQKKKWWKFEPECIKESQSLSLLLDLTTSNFPPKMGMPTPKRFWEDEVSDPGAYKVNCFFTFLQETLKWTFGELPYHTSKGKSPGAKRKLGPHSNFNSKRSETKFNIHHVWSPNNVLRIFSSITN